MDVVNFPRFYQETALGIENPTYVAMTALPMADGDTKAEEDTESKANTTAPSVEEPPKAVAIERGYSNPMFNVAPPACLSGLPTDPLQDLTYGVENPLYQPHDDEKVDARGEIMREPVVEEIIQLATADKDMEPDSVVVLKDGEDANAEPHSNDREEPEPEQTDADENRRADQEGVAIASMMDSTAQAGKQNDRVSSDEMESADKNVSPITEEAGSSVTEVGNIAEKTGDNGDEVFHIAKEDDCSHQEKGEEAKPGTGHRTEEVGIGAAEEGSERSGDQGAIILATTADAIGGVTQPSTTATVGTAMPEEDKDEEDVSTATANLLDL